MRQVTGDLEADLAKFYDQQAPERAMRRPPQDRDDARRRFVELLRAEGRTSVLEIGTGTGRDAVSLQAVGLAVSGIDLSAEHVRYCREAGIDCRQASLLAMPFEDDAFEAGWTMSVLLHVPNEQIDTAFAEIGRVLAPGAPLAVGVWGGPDEEAIRDQDRLEPARFFSRRSDEGWRRILERHGEIEQFEVWADQGAADEHYQFSVLRLK